MTDEQKKKAFAGFWITVALVAVLVGYPLSFGPACWLAGHQRYPGSLLLIARIYKPLCRHAVSPNGPVELILQNWADLFSGDDFHGASALMFEINGR